MWRDVQLVIFDCDGVLVDSGDLEQRACEVLTAEGLVTTMTQARREYQGMLLADIQARGSSNSVVRSRRIGLLAMRPTATLRSAASSNP